MTATALVPRASIEEIVRYRDMALGLYAEAFDAIEIADEKVKAAHAMARRAHPGTNGYNYSQAEEVKEFANAVVLPERERYLRTARKLLDVDVWSYIIERTDLERLMDREAKDKLRDQMKYVADRVDRRTGALIDQDEIDRMLPPVTVENIMATLEKFRGEADMIFRRGIANVFSELDRRFRSHDGFKVGSRLIVTCMFDDSGRLAYGRRRDMMIDIERVFAVMDGKPEDGFRSALGALELDRAGTWGPRQSEVETDYFKIRCFMNGNAHLWFKREDLVRKVNNLLAEYYGEVIGDGQAQEEDPLENKKLTPAKRFGFYPTPAPAVGEALKGFPILQRIEGSRLRILEPSAGTGNLARACAPMLKDSLAEVGEWHRERFEKEYREKYRFDNVVDCVEIQPALASGLEGQGRYNRVYCQDFLTLSPDVTGFYDRVVMNPPFDRERDIDHVVHALKFLKPDGWLLAIMSAGTEFRSTKKSTAFRKRMIDLRATFDDLPAGSFAESGTYCNTIVVTVPPAGSRQDSWKKKFEVAA